jgi:hypothetical protein
MAGGKATGRHLMSHLRGAGPLDPAVPTFVDRDKGPEIRGWLSEARNTGGFLVLVGDASVGKTRLLYEAASAVVPEFEFLHPDLGDGHVVNKWAEAPLSLPGLVVWLDELQRFLDGPYLTPACTPITSATIRLLLDAPTPVIILGALWPAYVSQLRATEPDPVTGQRRPRYPNAFDILAGPRLRYVSLYTFSPGEKKAAEELASKDPQLADAVVDPDYGVTEFLAGAPDLMRRYDQATEEQLAVLNAAIDARRVGIQSPLSEQLLSAAARGHLQTVHPDDTWFPPVLAELASQYRATRPLIPVPNADRTKVLGFTVADYLLQQLTWLRRSVPLPAVTWQALTDHTHDHDELRRLGTAAEDRLLYTYAELAYRRLADAGDRDASRRLAKLLARQGRTGEAMDVLRARARPADSYPADQLSELLAKLLAAHGRTDELRARADTGDGHAAKRLAELLAAQGRTDELRARADAGDE